MPILGRWYKLAQHPVPRPCRSSNCPQDDLFRLVIPVPESYVRYIRVGDSVNVRVPSLSNKAFPGKVARFSVDVKESTRTMHTEVDVPNPQHLLMPGIYAEADLSSRAERQCSDRASRRP